MAKRHWLAVILLVLCPAMLRADGGTLRFSKRCGDYRITLFTAPTTPHVGLVDFSVLVQAIDSETPLPDLPVTVFVHPDGRPERRIGGTATREAATNKLFRAISLELPEPGRWHVKVAVETPEGKLWADGELEIEPAAASWLNLAGWIAWPAAAVVLFVVHRCLVRRDKHRAQSPIHYR
jgi:hypothetical protein